MMLELSGQPSAATARRNLLGSPVLFDQEAQMDANSGEPWSEMDISDLTNDIAHGRTMAETASFLSGTRTRCGRRRWSLGWSISPETERSAR